MKTMLGKVSYYWYSVLDHLCSNWYKLYLGKVGKGSVIRRHCILDGNAINSISIGQCCDVASYCVLEAYSNIININAPHINRISIGNHCTIGPYSHITAINRVVIGDNLLTGRFVLITDNSHGAFSFEELQKPPANRKLVSKGEVVIGNNVWIGDKASILPGVHIGDGCVIGANSVVTHSFPAYSLIAGSPARLISQIDGNDHHM